MTLFPRSILEDALCRFNRSHSMAAHKTTCLEAGCISQSSVHLCTSIWGTAGQIGSIIEHALPYKTVTVGKLSTLDDHSNDFLHAVDKLSFRSEPEFCELLGLAAGPIGRDIQIADEFSDEDNNTPGPGFLDP